MNISLLRDEAIGFHQRGELVEAERRYREILASDPADFEALRRLGVLRFQQGRHGEALALFERALSLNPGHVESWSNRGGALFNLQRPDAALASYDKALALKPDYCEGWKKRGLVLRALNRPAEALASFDAALALSPADGELWMHRGIVLDELQRSDERLESFEKAVALRPGDPQVWYCRGLALYTMTRSEDAVVSYERAIALDPGQADYWHNRAVALLELDRHGEAMASMERALALRPDHPDSLDVLGSVLCAQDRIAEGFAAFTREARKLYGGPNPQRDTDPEMPHKLRHDAEQRDWLARHGGGAGPPCHLAGGERLAVPAVNPLHGEEIARRWAQAKPQIVVIDDFLTPEALDELRHFCLASSVWRMTYQNGYLGAMPQHGFASPLLAQIAGELRDTYPGIFGAHPLRYAWGFKYDSRMRGIEIHADRAAVNVNFWITPDEANLDPDHGGLVVWDVAAPLDWNFSKYNDDPPAVRRYLEQAGAKPTVIPYRANRAVIFDSDLFHETDTIRFREGYENRRINVTLLYGQRMERERVQ